ncbi:hypothetical protein HT102_09625 [Hoyosella sp. G463]|uniref:3-hydroxyacyl-CoA dehydrogenase n=1 Tax=Lolliginicoccus lacisalsi TaxID=2742202 RepID=A0A927JDC2_9ACTN|nr:hypothetical protein [Lolliginicoccus lacisalsi]
MQELVVLSMLARQIVAVSPKDGTVRVLVNGTAETPDGIVVDPARGHIYWTNMGTPDPGAQPGQEPTFFTRNGSIERVDLDGSNRRTIVPRSTFTTGKQLTADFDAGHLYWCDREGMRVMRCDLDGSHVETLVIAGQGEDARDPRHHCVGIAIDTVCRNLYWTQKGAPKSGQGRIFRASLDMPPGRTAEDRDDIIMLLAGLPEPIDLHLDRSDPNAGLRLVWTDRGAEPDGNTLNRAVLSPAAAASPEIQAYEILARGFTEAIGLASGDGITFYVTSLRGGTVRATNVVTGEDRTIVALPPGLTGIALADLPG